MTEKELEKNQQQVIFICGEISKHLKGIIDANEVGNLAMLIGHAGELYVKSHLLHCTFMHGLRTVDPKAAAHAQDIIRPIIERNEKLTQTKI